MRLSPNWLGWVTRLCGKFDATCSLQRATRSDELKREWRVTAHVLDRRAELHE